MTRSRDSLDSSGAAVSVELETNSDSGAYVVGFAGGPSVGRARFVDAPRPSSDRIIFHTEVDPEFAGRGLAGLLVREALADCIRNNLTVVPVCPLFARHLAKHGDEFVAAGGVFRRPRPADIALATRASHGR